jgi:GGDEF domain-containing protein
LSATRSPQASRSTRCRVDLPVTVGIGLAPMLETTRATVLAADVALYEAEAAGRNGVSEAAQGSLFGVPATKAVL